MKILILEDDKARVQRFEEKLKGEDIFVIFTDVVSACISALECSDFDVLFLDHDLDGKVYVPSDGDEPTGWHVAKWLSENPERQPAKIFLHSLNHAGRIEMMKQLPNAIDFPFAWECVSSEDGELKVSKEIFGIISDGKEKEKLC